MKRIEIITYSRSTGDIRNSYQTYTTTGAAEKELKKAGFTQNPRLPDIWYSEKYAQNLRTITHDPKIHNLRQAHHQKEQPPHRIRWRTLPGMP